MSREAYLDALGITVWARREPPQATPEPVTSPVEGAVQAAGPEAVAQGPVTPPVQPAPARKSPGKAAAKALGLLLGPGQGSCLFLCGSEDETASPLAADLARTLSGAPVWAKTAIAGDGVALEAAVDERLFTSVVIFGQAQALLALGGAAPERCGAARVIVVPELKRLASDPAARRSCWQALKSLGIGG
jgi:hypothetical protein